LRALPLDGPADALPARAPRLNTAPTSSRSGPDQDVGWTAPAVTAPTKIRRMKRPDRPRKKEPKTPQPRRPLRPPPPA